MKKVKLQNVIQACFSTVIHWRSNYVEQSFGDVWPWACNLSAIYLEVLESLKNFWHLRSLWEKNSLRPVFALDVQDIVFNGFVMHRRSSWGKSSFFWWNFASAASKLKIDIIRLFVLNHSLTNEKCFRTSVKGAQWSVIEAERFCNLFGIEPRSPSLPQTASTGLFQNYYEKNRQYRRRQYRRRQYC